MLDRNPSGTTSLAHGHIRRLRESPGSPASLFPSSSQTTPTVPLGNLAELTTVPIMSMPSHIGFGFHERRPVDGTFVHFPFEDFTQWALECGTVENESVLPDIESSLSKAQIKTDGALPEPVQPSTASTFALQVAKTTKALNKSIKMPKCHSSATLMHDVLVQYEENVLGAVCQVAKQRSTAVDETYADINAALAAHKNAQESSAVSGASTPGRLFELVLQERLSSLRASIDDLNVECLVAEAAYELRRRIDRLNAVREALDSKNPEDEPLTVITGTWCSFKDDQATPYSVKLKDAREALKIATSEMNIARQRLEDACGEDEFLLTSISNMTAKESSDGLLFFRSKLPDYVLKAGARPSASDHSVQQYSKKSGKRVQFAGLSGGDSDGDFNVSDDDKTA